MPALNTWAWGVVALGTVSSNQTLDCSKGNVFTLTLAADVTLDFANAKVGQPYVVQITQNGTGNFAVTWSSNVTIQGNYAYPADTTASTTSIFQFLGLDDTGTQVMMTAFSPISTAGTRLLSADDVDISVAAGLNTTAHTGGASGGVRRGLVWAAGRIGNVGGYNGKGSFQTWNHPVAGTVEDKQIFGTAGTPDTGLYIRWGYPYSVRYQLTGDSTTFCLYESVSGASWYHDFDTTTGSDRWRTSAAATIFDINGNGSVSIGVNGVANQSRGSLAMLGIAAPAGTPAAGNMIVWYDTTAKAPSFKNSVATYALMRLIGEGDLGNQTGAVALDLADRNFQKLTATGNITLTIINGTPGDLVELTFVQDGTGGRTLTLGAGLTAATGLTITPGAAAGATSHYLFRVLTATTGYLISASRA